MLQALSKWAIFNVAIAVLAPLLSYWFQGGATQSIGFWKLFSSSGEILVLSWALLADGIGDMLYSDSRSLTRKIVGGICILVLIFAVSAPNAIASQGNVTKGSWSRQDIFFISLLASASCKLTAAWEENNGW